MSLAACSDDQRSWETYDGSLTRIVYSSLGKRTCFVFVPSFSVTHTINGLYMFRAEPTFIVQRSYDACQVRFPCSSPRWHSISNTNASIHRYSFTLHATAQQLHGWTRCEKMKLKEEAVAEMPKEKQAHAQGEPRREEKPSAAEAEVNETSQGEMDNFQTPVVRRGPSAPFFFT